MLLVIPIGLIVIGVVFGGILAGICLGLRYLGLLLSRAPMPAWTFYIRLGWFSFALGLSTLLYFENDITQYLGVVAAILALTAWLVALATSQSRPHGRP